MPGSGRQCHPVDREGRQPGQEGGQAGRAGPVGDRGPDQPAENHLREGSFLGDPGRKRTTKWRRSPWRNSWRGRSSSNCRISRRRSRSPRRTCGPLRIPCSTPQRMFRKGYVSQLELEGQQFSVQRAQLELDSARTAKEVLEKYTKVKTLEDLQSKVETAKAKMESEKAAFALGRSPPQETASPDGQLRHLRPPGRHGGLSPTSNRRGGSAASRNR